MFISESDVRGINAFRQGLMQGKNNNVNKTIGYTDSDVEVVSSSCLDVNSAIHNKHSVKMCNVTSGDVSSIFSDGGSSSIDSDLIISDGGESCM